ncbi:MAG: ATP-binding protein [Planctomycetota bacterium]|jgi:signal transduction histidine kinase|nr:ATP-binding protein [Planctomycetota bacterium]
MTEEKQSPAEKLAQLGSLVAGFAHEIRNPLSTIGLNLQLVKEDFLKAETPRDKRTHKRLTVVEGEVKRLQLILEEFLRYARRPAICLSSVGLNGLLDSIVEFAVPEAEVKGIELRFFPGEGVGQIRIDSDQFRQVMVNLLLNAQDACSQGGEIMVATRRRDVDILVQVTDTGDGMDADALKRAFTPYFSTKKAGSGLGLSIARGIVEGHGGTIAVSSEPGKGTQFTITLPTNIKASSGAHEEEE